MPDLAQFLTFAAATLILNLTPGPDMMYIIARSLGQGRRAGLVFALGITGGWLFHAFAATVGLAARLRSWPIAFQLVRYGGPSTSFTSESGCWSGEGARTNWRPPLPPRL
jgi:threonine/homoserine/homoserine lactone efflux protein